MIPQTLLAAAKEHEQLDAADIRLISWICERACVKDTEALAVVTAALCRACANGSLCLPLEPGALERSLHDLLTNSGWENSESTLVPKALAQTFLAEAAAGAYANVLGIPEVSGGGKPESGARPLVFRENLLYFHRHFQAEKILALDLHARLQRPMPFRDPENISAVLREILDENPLRSGGVNGAPLILSRHQKDALAASLQHRVFILSGGPGTGKTTWTASWLRALLRLHNTDPARVRLCAPTGRAAQRLQESLHQGLESTLNSGGEHSAMDRAAREIPVETLHTLLGYQPYSGRFTRNEDDPLEADWVLLDEASMADAFLLAALVKALPPDAGLVLVGDADQLPSVEAGSALRELLPRANDTATGLPPSVVLIESHRAGGDILRLAAKVNAGDAEGLLEVLGPPVPFIRAFTEDSVTRVEAPGGDFARALPDLLRAYADARFLNRRVAGKDYPDWLEAFRVAPDAEQEALLPILWQFLSSARILAPARHGPLSANRINRLLRARLEPLFTDPMESGGFHGAALLITRNDARTGLANGESGVWLRSARGPQAFFPRPEGWLRLPVALLPAFESGFASTVHKSQGSEYDHVLLVLPEAGNRLLARETLYTGITRAKKSVSIFSSEAALQEAAHNSLRRHSGLRSWFVPQG